MTAPWTTIVARVLLSGILTVVGIILFLILFLVFFFVLFFRGSCRVVLVGIVPWVNVVMARLVISTITTGGSLNEAVVVVSTTEAHKAVLVVSSKEAVIVAMIMCIFLISIFGIFFLILLGIFGLCRRGGLNDFNLDLASVGWIIFFLFIFTPALEEPSLNFHGLKFGLALFSASDNDACCASMSDVAIGVETSVIYLFDSVDVFCSFLVDHHRIASRQVLLQDQFGGLADFKGDSILLEVFLGRALSQVVHEIGLLLFRLTMRLWPRGARTWWDALATIAGTVILMRSDRRRGDAFAVIAGTVILMRLDRGRRAVRV